MRTKQTVSLEIRQQQQLAQQVAGEIARLQGVQQQARERLIYLGGQMDLLAEMEAEKAKAATPTE